MKNHNSTVKHQPHYFLPFSPHPSRHADVAGMLNIASVVVDSKVLNPGHPVKTVFKNILTFLKLNNSSQEART